MKKDIKIIFITLILYFINQMIKDDIPFGYLKYFMVCYFNDLIGGITFMAYCGIIFRMGKKQLEKLWQILFLMFLCGIFWEYITPLFRHDTISDIYDIIAYMLGGFIYWCITNVKFRKTKE